MRVCAFISRGLGGQEKKKKKTSGTGGISVGMSVCGHMWVLEEGWYCSWQRIEVVSGGIRWWCEGVTGFRSLLKNEKGQVGNAPLTVYEKNLWHFKMSGGLAPISAWSFTEEPKNRHIQYTHQSTQTCQSLSISPTAMTFKTDFLSIGTDTHNWLYLHMSEHPDQA